MLTFAKNLELIRIAQQNDWVVFIIVGCMFLYVFMLISLQRDSSVREFLLQKFADSSNTFLSWFVISLVFCLLLSTFISQYIPVVPKKISSIQLLGFELNKFGFTFLSISVFYLMKTALSYLFFAGTGDLKKWPVFYFTGSKFYFCVSILLIILCIGSYFCPIDVLRIFPYYFGMWIFLVLFKVLFYFFHTNTILPEKWYYKFLYICTLQIMPLVVLWKVLFF
jgi:hypothetical protein